MLSQQSTLWSGLACFSRPPISAWKFSIGHGDRHHQQCTSGLAPPGHSFTTSSQKGHQFMYGVHGRRMRTSNSLERWSSMVGKTFPQLQSRCDSRYGLGNILYGSNGVCFPSGIVLSPALEPKLRVILKFSCQRGPDLHNLGIFRLYQPKWSETIFRGTGEPKLAGYKENPSLSDGHKYYNYGRLLFKNKRRMAWPLYKGG